MSRTRFAELLSDMYTQTLQAVNEHGSDLYVSFLLLEIDVLQFISAPTDLSIETQSKLIESLDSWNFEPHKLPEGEVLACALILFEALYRIEGMEEVIKVSLGACPTVISFCFGA